MTQNSPAPVRARPQGTCSFQHGGADERGLRKSGRGDDAAVPGIERRGDVWHLRSYAAVRQVLRDGGRTRQAVDAALGGGSVFKTDQRQPVIFQDGAAHREQRTAIAHFFTPRAVDERYRAVMEDLSDDIVSGLRREGRGDISAMTMRLAVEVAARVVGLTDSARPGMDRRIASLLAADPEGRTSPLRRAAASLLGRLRALRFYLMDVRPAIRARRRTPQEDVISHLLAQGYTAAEILIECMTYAVAGMITTREFIGMAAWHLLEDEALRVAYVTADAHERQRVLHEIVRLEPVAGHLYRRAAEDIRIESDGEAHVIPAGALLDLHLRAANADAAAVGERPLELRKNRDLPRGVQAPVLSFGDGAHRCPGAFIAIEETDVFLHRLLQVPLRVRSAPRLLFNDLLNSYEVRDFVVEVDAGPRLRPAS